METAVHKFRGSDSDRKFCTTLSQDDFILTARDFRPINFFPGNHALCSIRLMHRIRILFLSGLLIIVMFSVSLGWESKIAGCKPCQIFGCSAPRRRGHPQVKELLMIIFRHQSPECAVRSARISAELNQEPVYVTIGVGEYFERMLDAHL